MSGGMNLIPCHACGEPSIRAEERERCAKAVEARTFDTRRTEHVRAAYAISAATIRALGDGGEDV